MASMQKDRPEIIPRYDTAEVGRMLGIPPARARRWLAGYSRKGIEYPPLFQMPDGLASFWHMVSVLYAKELLVRGFSVQRIRSYIDELREHTGHEYPLVLKRVFVTRGQMYLERFDGEAFLQLGTNGQTALGGVIQEVGERLSFNSNDEADAWYPEGRDRHIIVDPTRAYGLPQIRGIGTDIIFSAYKGERENAETVAEWYEISVQDVHSAVFFEQRRSRAA